MRNYSKISISRKERALQYSVKLSKNQLKVVTGLDHHIQNHIDFKILETDYDFTCRPLFNSSIPFWNKNLSFPSTSCLVVSIKFTLF